MAIDLLRGNSLKTMTTAQTSQSTQSEGATLVRVDLLEAQKILQAIRSLNSGQTLQGEVIKTEGQNISLLLQNSVELQAQLDVGLNVNPGKVMTFEVKSNQNGKLALRPLFTNTGSEHSAIKALDAASIPVTDRTLQMVDELMQRGMPINKQTLNKIFSQSNLYPEANVRDIVLLNKLDIPVNQNTLEQLQLYQNNNQELTGQFSQISSEISNVLEGLMQTADGNQIQDVEAFVQGLKEIFLKGSDTGKQAEVPLANTTNIENESGTVSAKTQDGMTLPLDNNEAINASKELPDELMKMGSSQTESVAKELENLETLIKNGVLKKEGGKEAVKNSLLELLKNDLLMEPVKLENPEYVKEYYSKLVDRMDSLENLLQNTIGKDGKNFEATAQVKNNVDFMNQINELYHYVQLPLKMNKEQATGDLYVYKRKQARTGEDGTLTALLHLSMPTLGNMDIFLSLRGEQLNTKFTMEKEEMLDFIESHMDQLNERLIKKGYQANITVEASENTRQESVMERIMKEDKGIVLLSKQSFDARA